MWILIWGCCYWGYAPLMRLYAFSWLGNSFFFCMLRSSGLLLLRGSGVFWKNRDYCCFSIKIMNIHSSCVTAGWWQRQWQQHWQHNKMTDKAEESRVWALIESAQISAPVLQHKSLFTHHNQSKCKQKNCRQLVQKPTYRSVTSCNIW